MVRGFLVFFFFFLIFPDLASLFVASSFWGSSGNCLQLTVANPPRLQRGSKMWRRKISADVVGARVETPRLYFFLCVASLLIKILQRLEMELQLVASAAQPVCLLRFPVASKRVPPVRSNSNPGESVGWRLGQKVRHCLSIPGWQYSWLTLSELWWLCYAPWSHKERPSTASGRMARFISIKSISHQILSLLQPKLRLIVQTCKATLCVKLLDTKL